MKLSKFLISAVVLATPMFVIADDNNSDPENPPIIIVKKTNPGYGQHRIPSNQIIWISYDRSSETCEFSLPASVDYLYVTFEGEKTGYVYSTDVSLDNTTVSVSLPADFYTITCLSDEGASFYGEGYIN